MDEAGQQRARRERRAPKPLDEERLRELALHYVGRFATTRAKLRTYLERKLRERGWAGAQPPDTAALVERIGELGYVDDRVFALAKAGSLTARGLGGRRVRQALHQAGVGEEDAAGGLDLAAGQAGESALRFARRKRIGPFALLRPDPAGREKALAALVRAGHDFTLAKRIVAAEPGEDVVFDD
ncbi:MULTISPECIES: regulatory protein RecX [Sphingomonas]|uniref:regulatory protein RecX n=1 Tax=Sphingomonas TaxID=13687 RepID=UPI000DEFED67|nr:MULTISPECIES: RecX family transcriptional regulator [Sphingomonas]